MLSPIPQCCNKTVPPITTSILPLHDPSLADRVCPWLNFCSINSPAWLAFLVTIACNPSNAACVMDQEHTSACQPGSSPDWPQAKVISGLTLPPTPLLFPSCCCLMSLPPSLFFCPPTMTSSHQSLPLGGGKTKQYPLWTREAFFKWWQQLCNFLKIFCAQQGFVPWICQPLKAHTQQRLSLNSSCLEQRHSH